MAAEVKNFDSPDEIRPFEGNGQAKVVQLAGHAVAEGTFEPGWKWSKNVKPIAGTDSCQVAHFGRAKTAALTAGGPLAASTSDGWFAAGAWTSGAASGLAMNSNAGT